MFRMKKTTTVFLAVLMMVSMFATPGTAAIQGDPALNQTTWPVGKAFSYNVGQFFQDSLGNALSYSDLILLYPETPTVWTQSIRLSSNGILTGNAPASVDTGDYLLAFTVKDSAGNSIGPALPLLIIEGAAIKVSPEYWGGQSVSAYVGDSLRKTFSISNTGSQDLIVGAIAIEGTNASEFRKENDNASGKTIASGQSATLDIVFTPASVGDKIASLSIPSNASDTPLSVLLYPTALAKAVAPGAPLLSVAISGKTAILSWSISPNASGYTLWFSFGSDPSQYFSANMGNITAFPVELWGGAEFYVKIQAYNSVGVSAYSNEIFFRIPADPISSQAKYKNGDQCRITLPALPNGVKQYAGLIIPNNTTLYMFTGLNAASAFDGQLPEWKSGGTVLLDIPITDLIPRGEYTVYLLRVPDTLSDPMSNIAAWELGAVTFHVE